MSHTVLQSKLLYDLDDLIREVRLTGVSQCLYEYHALVSVDYSVHRLVDSLDRGAQATAKRIRPLISLERQMQMRNCLLTTSKSKNPVEAIMHYTPRTDRAL